MVIKKKKKSSTNVSHNVSTVYLTRVRIDHGDIYDASRVHYGGGDTVNVVAPWITVCG